MNRYAMVLLTLLAFAALLLAVAAWAGRRTHNAADLVLANRRLGTWLFALSTTANTVNGWLLMMIAGAAFAWGWSAMWICGAFVAGAALSLFFIAPRLRVISVAQGNATLFQVLSAEAGDRLQPLVARSCIVIFLLCVLLQAAAVLRFAGGLLVDEFGFNLISMALTSVFLITVGAFSGGLRACAMGDAVQVIAIAVFGVLLTAGATVAIGSWEEFQIALTALGPLATDWVGGREGVVALSFAAGVLCIGLSTTGQPQIATRYMAVRDEQTLWRGSWLALAFITLVVGAALCCGWGASVLYAGLERPELSMVTIADRMLPPLVAAFIVATLIAAVLANLGSQLLALASTLGIDTRRVNVPVSLAWVRAALVLATVLVLLSMFLAPATVFEHAMFGYTALGASFGPLLLVRLCGKRVRPGATLAAIWSGFILSLLFHLLPDAPGDFLERVMPFITSLGIALTGGERRRNPDRADRSQETVHDRVPI
jgi:sodium/proline symporter